MGRPVLAFNHGGSVELIKENKNGILSPVSNIEEYAKNINKSLSLSLKDREKISNESIKMVNQKYLTSNMCKKTINLYKNLISKKNEKNFNN